MKKSKLLMPILGATALIGTALPLVGLVGCNENSPTEELKFTVDNGEMDDSPLVGHVELSWIPEGDNVTISDLEFTYSGAKSATAEIEGSTTTNPLSIKLTFEEYITTDISDGALSFHYEDTTKSESGNKTIGNITVEKYVMETVKVNLTNCVEYPTTYGMWWLTTDQIDIDLYKIYQFTINCEKFGEHFPESLKTSPWLFTCHPETATRPNMFDGMATVSKNEIPLTKATITDPTQLESNQYCMGYSSEWSTGLDSIYGGKDEGAKLQDKIIINCVFDIEEKIEDVVMVFGAMPPM